MQSRAHLEVLCTQAALRRVKYLAKIIHCRASELSHKNPKKEKRGRRRRSVEKSPFKMKCWMCFAVAALAVYLVSSTEWKEEDWLFLLPLIQHATLPPPCPMNELYTTCTGMCSDCEQRGRCRIETCKAGCDCAPRFFRKTEDGPCEPVANCPRPECGKNEIFRECGPICERCTTLRCRVINCDHKCYCIEGHLRSENGTCVPEEECPKRKRCSHNEEWRESGPAEEFCLHGRNETVTNVTQSVAQCYCKENYKRNVLGNCITEALCPLIRCMGKEVYHNCIPRCNTTCRNYGNTNCTEDDNCYPGCFCPPGHVMNDFRSCVPVDECSLNVTQVKIFIPPPEEDDEIETTVVTSGQTIEGVIRLTTTPSTTENAVTAATIAETGVFTTAETGVIATADDVTKQGDGSTTPSDGDKSSSSDPVTESDTELDNE